jgi:predicted O-methyltransferase YrrM
MNDINEYFFKLDKKFKFEGGSGDTPDQRARLVDICKTYNCKNIMEIGFNAGHSANVFLGTGDDVRLTSFDLGAHEYVLYAKSFIDKKYPFRHNLIIGDSAKTVPDYFKDFKSTRFDLIFIDGDHSEIGALTDLVNCKRFAHSNTIVVLDDTRKTHPICGWNKGPNSAWQNCVNKKYIKEIGSEDYENKEGILSSAAGRGQSWGTYEGV